MLELGLEFRFPDFHVSISYVLFLWFLTERTAWVLSTFASELISLSTLQIVVTAM